MLGNGAAGQWNVSPGTADGVFGPTTKTAVEAFQAWSGVPVDGIVGNATWGASLHALLSTLESAVGYDFLTD